jgi:hypothetical protein
MENVFSSIFAQMQVEIDKMKNHLDNAMLRAENEIDKQSLDKLRNRYDKLDTALKNKDIDTLNEMLKDAN